jgi:hypothetical protein
MSTQHPITPPPELVTSLRDSAPYGLWETNAPRERWLINCAYAAGADQELEACCAEVLWKEGWALAAKLRDRRRPQPPSLKEQALAALEQVEADFNTGSFGDTIRRALEALQ